MIDGFFLLGLLIEPDEKLHNSTHLVMDCKEMKGLISTYFSNFKTICSQIAWVKRICSGDNLGEIPDSVALMKSSAI